MQQTMSEAISLIQHHQRILITGARAHDILKTCRKVLDARNKPYDVLTDEEQSISKNPIVFIVSSSFKDFDPHIILIDAVSNTHKDTFQSMADGLPKSGTLVYNSSDALAKEIGTKELEDVHLEEYTGEDTSSAAKKLLCRIGISEKIFDQTI